MHCNLKLMKLYKTLSVILSIIFFSGVPVEAEYSIERLEPPCWWVGMHNPELQLLIYGEKISELQPHIGYTGVSIKRVFRDKNPNYIFIDLLIRENKRTVSFAIDSKKAVKVFAKHNYQLFS